MPGPMSGNTRNSLREADRLLAAGKKKQASELLYRLLDNETNAEARIEAKVRLGQLQLTGQYAGEGEALLASAARGLPHPQAQKAAWLLALHRIANHRPLEAMPLLAGLDRHLGPESGAWDKLLEVLFANPTPEVAAAFRQALPPPPLGSSHAKRFLELSNAAKPEALESLLMSGALPEFILPFFKLALGDRLQQQGETPRARQLWAEVAALAPEGAGEEERAAWEARLRLRQAPSGETVPVGLLLPLSGRHAALGRNLLHAAQKALNDHPDAPLSLTVADSSDDPGVTRAGMERLLGYGVQAVIGPVFHESAVAAIDIAVSKNIPIMTLNNRTELLGRNSGPEPLVFLNAFLPEQQAEAMAAFATQGRSGRRTAILAPDNTYGKLVARAYSREVTRLGGQVVQEAYFPEGTRDFSPWLKTLTRRPGGATGAAAATPLDFDTLFLPVRAEDARIMVPQTQFFGMQSPEVTLLGTSQWKRPELLAEGTAQLIGVVFCDVDDVAQKRFEESYRAVWREAPNSLAVLAYDSVAILAQLLRDQRSGGPSWRSALVRAGGFRGATGELRITSDGAVRRDYRLFTVDQQGIVPLMTVPAPGGNVGSPGMIPTPAGVVAPPAGGGMDDVLLKPSPRLAVPPAGGGSVPVQLVPGR
ncbi:MAG: penicillin-binding protein activator [Magnetococcales bacterium]|nr:penicillin-binding protein activator [Magnetococcales bacterium]